MSLQNLLIIFNGKTHWLLQYLFIALDDGLPRPMKIIAAITTYLYQYNVLCIGQNTRLEVHNAQRKTRQAAPQRVSGQSLGGNVQVLREALPGVRGVI